jgi:alkylhydroperoxidase family enzyme
MEEQREQAVLRGRLPWLTPDQLNQDQRRVYDAIIGGPRSKGPQVFKLVDDHGRLEGPFNSFLMNPTVGLAVQAVGAAIRYGSLLSDRQREIAILELAHLESCEFEKYAHERVGRELGLTEVEITALAEGAACSSFHEEDLIVRELVVALQGRRELDDELYLRALESLDYEGLADVVVLVGYYQMLALSLKVWRTPLPDEDTVEG